MSHPLPERVKKSVRLDIQAIAIISDYAAKHGCNETDALNRLILATQEQDTSHPPLITSHPLIDTSHPLPPTATHNPLVERVLELETQMLEVGNRLDAIDRDKTHPIASPEDTGSESVAVDSKRYAESSFILDKGGTSTSLELVAIDPAICEAIIAALRPHPESGYYFRSEYLGQTKIKHSYRHQAMKMGFSSESTRIDGKPLRVWLNRDYRLQSADT